MCGVFCIASKSPISNNLLNKANSISGFLKHRGPDGDGIWCDKNAGVVLGHTRLSVLDLTDSAKQPMLRCGITLSYNGEIYNYKEIRSKLELRGYIFTSTGDTEVVLYAWKEWGYSSFDMFDGMFSIIIFDGDTITCATDRFGEKTLYYKIENNQIYISSELSSLVNVLNLTPKNNQRLDTLFMLNGYIPSPETYYKGTYRMGPAEVINIKKSTIISRKTYWKLPELDSGRLSIPKLSTKDVSLLRRALIESIESRLHSDAPMCLFLSAGIDSSLIASILKLELNYDIDCITAFFGTDRAFNESSQAADVASYLKLNHQCVNINVSSHSDISNKIIKHYGQPFDTVTTFAMSDMTRAVKGKYKVGLTGFGGDEVFFGYGKHAYVYKYRMLMNSPNVVRSAIGNIVNLVSFNKNTGINSWIKNLINVKDNERYLAMKLYPAINTLRELPHYNEAVNSQYNDINNIVEYTYINELTNVMPNSRCISADLGSMKSGFEFRTPFLNKNIINVSH